ncbi:hypothetical protein [uncultured Clostridium sp.]|uniref:hypothetical protein n=1 Tax=uncultured Clostridium sp. TaxID=59620 RepID=UPI00263B77E1|nr:hypothetical protein [uncultured Clostridium sp.]
MNYEIKSVKDIVSAVNESILKLVEDEYKIRLEMALYSSEYIDEICICSVIFITESNHPLILVNYDNTSSVYDFNDTDNIDKDDVETLKKLVEDLSYYISNEYKKLNKIDNVSLKSIYLDKIMERGVATYKFLENVFDLKLYDKETHNGAIDLICRDKFDAVTIRNRDIINTLDNYIENIISDINKTTKYEFNKDIIFNCGIIKFIRLDIIFKDHSDRNIFINLYCHYNDDFFINLSPIAIKENDSWAYPELIKSIALRRIKYKDILEEISEIFSRIIDDYVGETKSIYSEKEALVKLSLTIITEVRYDLGFALNIVKRNVVSGIEEDINESEESENE